MSPFVHPPGRDQRLEVQALSLPPVFLNSEAARVGSPTHTLSLNVAHSQRVGDG